MTKGILTLVTQKNCSKCRKAEEMLKQAGLQFKEVDASSKTGRTFAASKCIILTPTLILSDSDGTEICRAASEEEIKDMIKSSEFF